MNEISDPDREGRSNDTAQVAASLMDASPAREMEPNPDQAWKALTLINDWIKHAEAKAGITLAATGASGVLLYNLVKNQSDPGLILSLFAALAGIAGSSYLRWV